MDPAFVGSTASVSDLNSPWRLSDASAAGPDEISSPIFYLSSAECLPETRADNLARLIRFARATFVLSALFGEDQRFEDVGVHSHIPAREGREKRQQAYRSLSSRSLLHADF